MIIKKEIEKIILNIWYPKSRLLFIISKILSPIGFIYFFVSYLKSLISKASLLDNKEKKPHIIIVGNITAGGTGKTPIVIFIAKQLYDLGYKVAVITRGYGGLYKLSTPILIKKEFDPITYSDEAVLLASELKDIPVISCRKRENSINFIKSNYEVDIIISDDGLQYNGLSGNTKIIVIDGQRGFGNSNYIPVGPFRNSLSFLQKTDQIIINSNNNDNLFKLILKYNKNIIFTKPVIKHVREIYGSNVSIIDDPDIARETILKYNFIHLITAIGNSEKFFNTVLSLLEIEKDNTKIQYHSFPDHYIFSESNFNDKKSSSIYVMTSKDAVKLKSIKFNTDIRYFVIEIDTPIDMEFILKKIK